MTTTGLLVVAAMTFTAAKTLRMLWNQVLPWLIVRAAWKRRHR